MAIKGRYQVICDKCGTGANAECDSASFARKIAKDDGWADALLSERQSYILYDHTYYYRDAERGDFCPACLKTHNDAIALIEQETTNVDR